MNLKDIPNKYRDYNNSKEIIGNNNGINHEYQEEKNSIENEIREDNNVNNLNENNEEIDNNLDEKKLNIENKY